ncbi:MAG: NAD-dependent epimerase/dehydratase family protein [Selenomonas ruminantium]|nr:NAD-dependent epimerase/dehydratase family protein [Selenomonas ruminantium]
MISMVIGGAGFIGSHLCRSLLANGDEVHCVDDFSLGKKENITGIMQNEDFYLHKIDASNRNELLSVFKEAKPEQVFHLAANSDIQASAKNPEVEYMRTYTTTYQVLSCMRECGVKKLFFASTSAVYGDKRDVVLNEMTPNLEPISYYGAAKLGSEALISAFSYMNDMHSLIFRFPNVIGPHLTHGVIYDFVRRLRDNPQELTILGDGKQTKPYIYVSDLVEAIIRFRNVPQGVTLYNLGVEGATQVTRIAEIIVEEMGLKDVRFKYTGGEGGWKGDVPKFQYDLSKIHKAGWYAKLDSDEAVRRTVREYLKG